MKGGKKKERKRASLPKEARWLELFSTIKYLTKKIGNITISSSLTRNYNVYSNHLLLAYSSGEHRLCLTSSMTDFK